MRHFRSAVLVAGAVLGSAISAGATVIDYQGYAWETGGFPPGVAGDSLRIPLVVTGMSPQLAFDPVVEEVTGFLSGLVSSGPQDAGDGIVFFAYGTGRLEFFRDPTHDREFGEFPPNATVPSTFTNGTLCLGGTVQDFVLFFDAETGTGAYEGTVHFVEGECLDRMSAGSAEGFTFGGVLTRTVSGSIPPGYDISVDGFLQAVKQPLGECPFECIELVAARLDFPRRPRQEFRPTDGKFRIDGVFTPCADFGEIDPSQLETRVRIGDYTQVFPAGTLELEPDDDGDREWEFKNHGGTRTITELEIELESDGFWEFEIEGRGIPRADLLPEGLQLEVEITLGDMNGTAQAMLVQKKNRLRFKGEDEHPCPLPAPPPPPQKPVTAWELRPAAPNPFNATTTIALRAAEPGPASLRIYDVRGRLVRTLLRGDVTAGEHRFVWHGDDETGRAVASGVYVYRLEAPGHAVQRKMVVAK